MDLGVTIKYTVDEAIGANKRPQKESRREVDQGPNPKESQP